MFDNDPRQGPVSRYRAGLPARRDRRYGSAFQRRVRPLGKRRLEKFGLERGSVALAVWPRLQENHAAILRSGAKAEPRLHYLVFRERLKKKAPQFFSQKGAFCGWTPQGRPKFARPVQIKRAPIRRLFDREPAIAQQLVAFLEREARDRLTREQGRPTLPSTMALEKATNPFLRCEHPAVIEAASHFSGSRLDDAVTVFAAVREWRNRF